MTQKCYNEMFESKRETCGSVRSERHSWHSLKWCFKFHMHILFTCGKKADVLLSQLLHFFKMHLSYQPFHYTRNTTTIQNLSSAEHEMLGASCRIQNVPEIGGVAEGGKWDWYREQICCWLLFNTWQRKLWLLWTSKFICQNKHYNKERKHRWIQFLQGIC